MLAIRPKEAAPSLKLVSHRPVRASIGAQRNPESTRAILDAAESILREEGLSGLSMDAIARRARCGKPTLYRWWPHKSALLAEIHERALASIKPNSAESVEERLGRWAGLWQTTLAGLALRGMLAEAQSSAQAMEILNDRGLSLYRSALEELVGQAEAEGMMQDLIVPMLGRLMLQREPQSTKPVPRRAAIFVEARPQAAEAATTFVHRGEWVD